MIRNIIFDIAQVLIQYQMREFALKQGGDPQRMLQAVRMVEQYSDWSRVDQGLVSEEEMIATLLRENPQYREELNLFIHRWYQSFVPMAGMEDLIQRLQAAGYFLYYLSNFPGTAFRSIYQNFPVFRLVRQGIASYEVGLCKPDPRIYQALLDKFNLSAAESVFIDDRAENTAVAAQMGFCTHTFTTAQELEQSLRQQGLQF